MDVKSRPGFEDGSGDSGKQMPEGNKIAADNGSRESQAKVKVGKGDGETSSGPSVMLEVNTGKVMNPDSCEVTHTDCNHSKYADYENVSMDNTGDNSLEAALPSSVLPLRQTNGIGETKGEDNTETEDDIEALLPKCDVDSAISPEETPASPDRNSSSQSLSKSCEDKEKSKDGDDDEWTYVLGHNKLRKRTLKSGNGFATRPQHGQRVTVRYVEKLLDGEKEVNRNESVVFILGDGDVVQALDLCIALMELEEVSEIITESQYAYGKLGRDPDIPPNATLIYEVELLYVDEAPEYATMAICQRIAECDKKREKGNWLYSRGENGSAINTYTKALKVVDQVTGEESATASDLQLLLECRMKCYNNLAAAQIKVEAWDAALKSCEEVLKAQPENVKALFRKGKCLVGKNQVDNAIALLRKGLVIDPDSKAIHNELTKLIHRKKTEEMSEKALYRKMFSSERDSPSDNNQEGSHWMLYAGAVVAASVSIGLAAYRYLHW